MDAPTLGHDRFRSASLPASLVRHISARAPPVAIIPPTEPPGSPPGPASLPRHAHPASSYSKSTTRQRSSSGSVQGMVSPMPRSSVQMWK
jgi:hypothetical protein